VPLLLSTASLLKEEKNLLWKGKEIFDLNRTKTNYVKINSAGNAASSVDPIYSNNQQLLLQDHPANTCYTGAEQSENGAERRILKSKQRMDMV